MFIWFKLYCADYSLRNEIAIGKWKYAMIKVLPVRWNMFLLLCDIEISPSLFRLKMGGGVLLKQKWKETPEICS